MIEREKLELKAHKTPLECFIKYVYGQSKKKGKDQESTQSRTTPDPGYQWESDNFTIRHQKRELRGQPFLSR